MVTTTPVKTSTSVTTPPPAYDTTTGGRTDYGSSIGAPIVQTGAVNSNYTTSNPISTATSPATIVTSGQSKTNYANNVSTLAQANTNLANANQTISSPTPATTTTTPPPTVPDTSTSVSSTINGDGSTSTVNKDGSQSLTYADGQSFQIPAGMDPTMAKLQYDNERRFQKMADDAQQALSKATANVDADNNGTNSAALAAANTITSNYATLIQQMQEKNAMLAGSAAKNSARSGMLQYANEMDTNYKSEEMDKAIQRIATLTQQRDDAVLKSNQAFKDGDVKALDLATKEYESAVKENDTAIVALQKMTSDQVKQNAADIKAAQTADRQQTIDDHNFATQNARDIALQLQGVTDPKKQEKILIDAAETYGISNPNVLKSAVENEMVKISKEDIETKKSNATLNKLLAGPKATAADKENDVIGKFSDLFTPGVKDKSGTPVVDDSGYVTPAAWNKLIKAAPSEGLSRAKFIQNFADKIYKDDKGNVSRDYNITPVEIKKYITGTTAASQE